MSKSEESPEQCFKRCLDMWFSYLFERDQEEKFKASILTERDQIREVIERAVDDETNLDRGHHGIRTADRSCHLELGEDYESFSYYVVSGKVVETYQKRRQDWIDRKLREFLEA